MMRWYWGMPGWEGYGGINWLFPIIFWIVLIVVVVAIIRSLSGYHRYDRYHYRNGYGNRNGAEEEGSTALEILKERYAKGEIDKKEFDQKKKDIS